MLGHQTSMPIPFLWQSDILLLDPEAARDVPLARFVADAGKAVPVLLVGWEDPSTPEQYVASGVAGFVDRRTDAAGLVAAIRKVASGGNTWSVNLPSAHQPGPAADEVVLSPRERQVLRQIARGLTHGQVARRLGISPHTVDTYVKRIRSKLNLGNKAELTRAAVLGSFDAEGVAAEGGPPLAGWPQVPRQVEASTAGDR